MVRGDVRIQCIVATPFAAVIDPCGYWQAHCDCLFIIFCLISQDYAPFGIISLHQ